MKIRTMLVAGLLAAACRSAAGGPGPITETDAAVVTDTPVAPMDRNCSATGMENTNATCGDGVDNDCDGFVDCNDFDCSRSPTVTLCPRDAGPPDTGCIPRAENTNATCGDGVDNDCDGFVDCNDFDCSRSPSVTLCPRDAGPPWTWGASLRARKTPTPPAATASTTTATATSTASTSTAPATGHPRDGVPRRRGARDTGNFRDTGPRADAVGCVRTGAENTLAACNDGIDNDCDGYVDCADRNCSCVGQLRARGAQLHLPRRSRTPTPPAATASTTTATASSTAATSAARAAWA
jgi:hypothetical protein